jgi:uncharacterized protein (TIGR02594 family)
MPSYRTDVETPLFKARDLASEKLGTISAGTVFTGEQIGNFIKTKISTISSEEGFVRFGGASSEIPEAQPLTAADFGNFCDLVTRAARETGADRDYLMAVAYDATNNLTNFGAAGSPKAGPFQYTAEEWQTALAGPAKDNGFLPDDRLNWTRQPKMAAILAREATTKFKKSFDQLPTFKELYFLQLVGDDALTALKTPTKSCRDVLADNPPAGSYAASLKTGDLTVEAAMAALQARLEAAYAAALPVIDAQPPDNRFMRTSVGDPPWMAVAREQMASGVSETPDFRNTEQISKYFQTLGAQFNATTPWCGAFAGFCVKQCGVPAIASTVPAAAVGTPFWEGWGQAATDPPPVGAIVVLTPPGSTGHVGFLAEPPTSGFIKLLGGNQGGGGGARPDRVGIVQFPAASVKAIRWMGAAPTKAAPRLQAGDSKFVEMAPVIMKKLRTDFPELTDMHAAAILGNIGHECAGFTQMQEGAPIGGGRGGWGWCQWTGERRNQFEAAALAANPQLAFDSFDANYGFLRHELKNTFHKAAITSMLKKADMLGAVVAFELIFDVAHPDFKHYDRRLRYAEIALSEFRKTPP